MAVKKKQAKAKRATAKPAEHTAPSKEHICVNSKDAPARAKKQAALEQLAKEVVVVMAAGLDKLECCQHDLTFVMGSVVLQFADRMPFDVGEEYLLHLLYNVRQTMEYVNADRDQPAPVLH